MEEIKQMKEALIASAQSQMGNLHQVDAHELGEVIDMIKDLEEAEYYCTITKAMHEKDEEEKYAPRYFTRYVPPYGEEEYYRDVDRPYGRMYYTETVKSTTSMPSSQSIPSTSTRGYEEWAYPINMRDKREGRSPISRKTYMESKEMHKDSATQMKDLEDYITGLSQDIIEMIQIASPDEKTILAKKLSTLASKIN